MIEAAVFGGGCFWCTEAIFKSLRGVTSVLPGYSGGGIENPTYAQVSTGETGHAEVIKIEFDPSVINYSDLVEIFMYTHDPTTLNRQGNDIGTQYRSVIFYLNSNQKEVAQRVIDKVKKEKAVVTTLEEFKEFYEAENYHRDYYDRNMNQAYCQIVISPKLIKLREKYSDFLK